MNNSGEGFLADLKIGIKANYEYSRRRLNKLKGKHSKNKKAVKRINAKSIIAALIFMIVACICVLIGIYMNNFAFSPEEELSMPTSFITPEEDDNGNEQHNAALLTELENVDGLTTLLKLWSTNEKVEKIHEDEVYNFLLVGLDASASVGYGNSDAIILVSVNTKTANINMVSFYRDSYTYIKTAQGDNYAKINAAYANGGAPLLVSTVENDYKIDIDYYASVNFETFVEVVDLLGGVTLNVPEYVANYIGSAWNTYCPSGDAVLLNGAQALRFVRARHCDADSDVSRTRRQREFISSLVSAASTIKASQIDDVLGIVSNYVKTDCPNKTLMSLAARALREKWYDYEISSSSVPSEEYRTDYGGFGWVWIVDYPGAAQALQKQLYGYTNFELTEGTPTAVELIRTVVQAEQTKAPSENTQTSETPSEQDTTQTGETQAQTTFEQSESTQEQTAEQTTGGVWEQTTQEQLEQPTEQQIEQPTEQPTEQLTEPSTEQPTESPTPQELPTLPDEQPVEINNEQNAA